MLVEVRLFAVLAERAGSESVQVELEEGATVRDALDAVARKPGLRDPLERLKVVMAVNREYAHMDVVLHPGDELALIPPVSGGAVEASSVSPAATLLGLRSIETSGPGAQAQFDAPNELTNPTGVIQGGFQMAMLDEVLRAVAREDLEPQPLVIKMNYFRPVSPGRLVARAKLIHSNDSHAFATSSLLDEQGRLLGTATATMSLSEPARPPEAPGEEPLPREGELNQGFAELVASKAGGAPPPCARTLGAWPLSAELGRVSVEYATRQAFLDPSGHIQAGFLGAMMDDTIGPAALSLLEAGKIVPTIELEINLLQRGGVGRLVCEAQVVHKGGSIAFSEATLRDADEQVVATATGTARIVDLRTAPEDG